LNCSRNIFYEYLKDARRMKYTQLRLLYEGEISNCLSTLGVHSIERKWANYRSTCTCRLILSTRHTTGQANQRSYWRFSFPYLHVLRIDRSYRHYGEINIHTQWYFRIGIRCYVLYRASSQDRYLRAVINRSFFRCYISGYLNWLNGRLFALIDIV